MLWSTIANLITGFTRFFNHLAIAILTGLMFLQLDDSRSSLQYRVFVSHRKKH